MKIDPRKIINTLEARLARETNTVLRRNLEVMMRHARAEVLDQDVDAIMSTITDVDENAVFHIYMSGLPDIKGRAAIRQMYESGIASGKFLYAEFDVDRLVVDVHCIAMDGTLSFPYTGEELAAMGHQVDDPKALYMWVCRHVLFVEFDNKGLMLGEDLYCPPQGFDGIENRKVTPANLVSR